MLKAWKTYKSKTLGCDCIVIDDDRLHNENCKTVTVNVILSDDLKWSTVLFKDDLH